MKNTTDTALFLMRLGLGVLFVVAGFGKITGILGPGINTFSGLVFGSVLLAWIVAIVELLGGIMLLVGYYTKYAAYALAVIILGSIILVHGPGFSGNAVNFFIHISLITSLVGIGLIGPGMISVQKK